MKEKMLTLIRLIDDNGLIDAPMPDKVINALYAGVEQMELAIPEPPTSIIDTHGLRFGRCPRCSVLVNDHQKGCPECRGAIDWGERQ